MLRFAPSLFFASILLLLGASSCAPRKNPQVVRIDFVQPELPEKLRVALAGPGESRRLRLEELMSDSDVGIRLIATQIVALAATPESVPALMRRLRDSNHYVRERARHGLAAIGRPAITALLDELERRESNQRMALGTDLFVLTQYEGGNRTPADMTAMIMEKTRTARCSGSLCVSRLGFPSYPALARSARVNGRATLEFVVKDGVAVEITASGDGLFLQSAEETLKQFRFEEAEGGPGQRHKLTIDYELGDARPPYPSTYDIEGEEAFDFVLPHFVRYSRRKPPPLN